MTVEMAFRELDRIANLKGNETIPTEDVIDIAQAVLTIFYAHVGTSYSAPHRDRTPHPGQEGKRP